MSGPDGDSLQWRGCFVSCVGEPQRSVADYLMEPSILTIWNQKEDWFHDHIQADRVGAIVVERLADDRIQEECRYLMRLKWHFHMGYEEVSYEELQRFVSAEKMKLLDELFACIATRDYVGIETWVERCESELPVIEDRWMQANRVTDS
jgi:hypothetical protein